MRDRVAYSKIKSALLFSASVTTLAILAGPALAQQVAQSDTDVAT